MNDSKSTTDSNCFTPVAGLQMVYEPGCGIAPARKKHPCPDCHYCQSCSEARCQSCRVEDKRTDKPSFRKLSMREQILLFEKINNKSYNTGS